MTDIQSAARGDEAAAAKAVEEWLPKVGGVVDVVNQTIVIGPAVNFRVDPERAQRAGFSVSESTPSTL